MFGAGLFRATVSGMPRGKHCLRQDWHRASCGWNLLLTLEAKNQHDLQAVLRWFLDKEINGFASKVGISTQGHQCHSSSGYSWKKIH
jgi:hypothetical protein